MKVIELLLTIAFAAVYGVALVVALFYWVKLVATAIYEWFTGRDSTRHQVGGGPPVRPSSD